VAWPELVVLAATGLEATAVRRRLPAVPVIRCGVGLRRLRDREPAPVVVTCGLAGALVPLAAGTVLVPDLVGRPRGDPLRCDGELVEALVAGARRLGLEPERGPLACSPDLVVGPARQAWAELGYVAVDMETGLLQAPRVATVRVVLDGPGRELDPAWGRGLPPPRAWRQVPWLAREGRRGATRAAAVLAAALAG
jgi:hypothetical protein